MFNLNTEKKNDWFSDYVKRQKLRDEELKIMMSNSSYIEWLKAFTLNRNVFTDEEFLYDNDSINEKDLVNVRKLSLLYEGIDDYARQNYINAYDCDFGNFYKVRLDDFYFEIGTLAGQGVLFFFRKASENDKNTFINFNDIINGKVHDNLENINELLNSIKELVISAYNNGATIESINSTVNNAVNIAIGNDTKILIRKY